MTEREAKKYMLIEKECINRDCNRDCANCDIVQDVEDLNNAYDAAIKALEKQIPKKIAKYDVCPVCNNNQSTTWYYVGSSYCEICGQKLDWDE